MKRFTIGLTTIVALVAMTLLGLTVPAAHADDGSPSTPVVLQPDVVTAYPGDLVVVNPLLNDSGHNLELVGYRNLVGSVNPTLWGGSPTPVAINQPNWDQLTLAVGSNAAQPITLEYLVTSNEDTGTIYVSTLAVNVKQPQALKVKRVKGKKGRFDVLNLNPNDPNCTDNNCGYWLALGNTNLYRLKPQQHTIIKINKQYFKYLASHKKIPLVVYFHGGGGNHLICGTLKHPMGKKAYKQYKKAHKHHTS